MKINGKTLPRPLSWISASTAERANLLTKTHHDDLDVISELLQEVIFEPLHLFHFLVILNASLFSQESFFILERKRFGISCTYWPGEQLRQFVFLKKNGMNKVFQLVVIYERIRS